MGLSGNWLLAERIVTTILYKLLRLVFIIVQRIYWELNGTAKELREARLPHNYERSAQVLDVVLCYKFSRGNCNTIDNFLCTHNRFENPQYIIDNEHVTLLTFTEHDAVFCEAKEKGMHLWHHEYGSFLRLAQLDFCRRLIVVPLTTFHRLAEVIGVPQGELIFLYNTARCGSTLFSRIMECTGRCVAMSEPNSPTLLARKYGKSLDSSKVRHLARDIIRWECRPYPSMQPPPLGYYMHFMPDCIILLPMFRDLFPSSRCLFMYRHVVPSTKSVYRMSMVMPQLRLMYLFGHYSSHVSTAMSEIGGSDRTNLRMRLDHPLMFGVLMWSLIIDRYLEFRRRGLNVNALRYEDLVAQPLEMCRVALEYCHLPVSLAEMAVRAFNADSQAIGPLAKSTIGKFKEPQLTPEIKTKLNDILKKCGMPLIGEPGIIEGSLSCD